MSRIATVLLALSALAAVLTVHVATADVPVTGPEAVVVINATSAASGIVAINTSAGNRLALKAIRLSSTSAGICTILDGSTAGTVIGSWYLKADVPLSIGSDLLGPGALTTSGNSLFLDQAGTVTATIRYRLEH